MIDPLVVLHDREYSRAMVPEDKITEGHRSALPAARHRLVLKNPSNQAKNYFIGSHAKEIEGWTFEESRNVLDMLHENATAKEHVYCHKWQSGDMLIWDDRCTLHRGSGYDPDRFRRRLRKTHAAGVKTL